MAINRAIIGNVVLGLGVIGLGALVIAERGVSGAKRDAEAAVTAPAPAREPLLVKGAAVLESAPAAEKIGVAAADATGASPKIEPATPSMTASKASLARDVASALAKIEDDADPSKSSILNPQSAVTSHDEATPAPPKPPAKSATKAPTAVASAPKPAPAAASEPDAATDEELLCEAPAAAPVRAGHPAASPAGIAIPTALLTKHVVKPGDTLLALSRANKVTSGLIRRLNGLKDDTIRVGKELYIPQGPFAATIDRSTFTLAIILHGETVKQYAVATGRDGSTPSGDFEVKSRVENPEWTSPEGDFFKAGDAANPLGTRWLGFGEGGYGIHGTTDPNSIGREASHGCVRLNNEDVLEVYDFLTLGSKVTIR